MSTEALISEHGVLPLPPLDRPSNWLVRALFGASRRHFGRTPMAFRVLFTRAPWLALVTMAITTVMFFGLRIGMQLAQLLQVSTSMRVGCTFCSDLVMAEAIRARVGRERFAQLLDFETSSAFSAREKAALAYSSAVADSLRVSDAVWARLAEHFTERERVEIVWVCAVERYFNSMALPLRIGSDHLSGPA
jgi:alkylhydroperoxidase family enzyme